MRFINPAHELSLHVKLKAKLVSNLPLLSCSTHRVKRHDQTAC